jgi:hypothetical protein
VRRSVVVQAARIRYELRVGTLVSKAALATFRIHVRHVAVPRKTVYRFRVIADRDLSEVLDRLTDHDVEVLEIRQCAEPPRRERRAEPAARVAPPQETGETGEPAEAGVGVILPFRARTGPSPSGAGPAPGPGAEAGSAG